MEHLVTVIVPVYNVEVYLERCIKSIINQDYKNLEIILVDDGSKDSSGKICDQYAKEDSRIRVIHKENQGLGPARNTAMDLATGEFLFFVDSDDYILEGILGKLCRVCVEEEADIACCGYQTGSKVYYCQGEKEALDTILATQKMLMCEDMDANAVCKLYRRELFQRIYYPACAYEVVPVTYKVYLRTKKVVNIKECGYYIEKRPGSITRSKFGKNNLLYLTLSKEMMEDIKEHYPKLKEASEIFYLNALIAMTEKSHEDPNALNTEEFRIVNKEFHDSYKTIMCSSYISKRKKMISWMLRVKIYAFIKRIYDRV